MEGVEGPHSAIHMCARTSDRYQPTPAKDEVKNGQSKDETETWMADIVGEGREAKWCSRTRPMMYSSDA